MPRPIFATIDPAALRHNLARSRHAAPEAKVWAVVKANAYGHGIEHVFEGLGGANGFAVLDTDEAQRVRGLGWRALFCCWKVYLSRMTWMCALAWTCGTPCIVKNKSTCWQPTKPMGGTIFF